MKYTKNIIELNNNYIFIFYSNSISLFVILNVNSIQSSFFYHLRWASRRRLFLWKSEIKWNTYPNSISHRFHLQLALHLIAIHSMKDSTHKKKTIKKSIRYYSIHSISKPSFLNNNNWHIILFLAYPETLILILIELIIVNILLIQEILADKIIHIISKNKKPYYKLNSNLISSRITPLNVSTNPNETYCFALISPSLTISILFYSLFKSFCLFFFSFSLLFTPLLLAFYECPASYAVSLVSIFCCWCYFFFPQILSPSVFVFVCFLW